MMSMVRMRIVMMIETMVDHFSLVVHDNTIDGGDGTTLLKRQMRHVKVGKNRGDDDENENDDD